jgi:hypothetical protein
MKLLARASANDAKNVSLLPQKSLQKQSITFLSYLAPEARFSLNIFLKKMD